MKKITVIIPCRNEQKGIDKVICGIPYKKLGKFGFKVEVLVVNNASSDKTGKCAIESGAVVINEPNVGKGIAMRSGFKAVSQNTNYVVMMDGDNTYKGKEIFRMIEPLDSGFCDAVVGSRLGGKLETKSLCFKNRIANWLYTFLVRSLYLANITDVLSGFFAWKKKSLDKLVPYLESDGFALEIEMITKMKKLGLELYSVPITYDKRIGESKINSFEDGVKILFVLFKNLFWKPERNLTFKVKGVRRALQRLEDFFL